jgi:rhomboid protease GluP
LIALNVVVYLAMGFSGVSWVEPSAHDAVKWGADFGVLTLSGQWWRLLTSMFVHFGAIHIGLNMWCLWDLGRLSERLMGRRALALVYFATGLSASLTSLGWDPIRVSAGASGAVFGVAGAFFSFLYFRKSHIDLSWAKSRLRSVGIFILYNLFYGLRGGIDNSAHIGGLVAGLVLGAVLAQVISHASFDQMLGAMRGGSSAAPVPREFGAEDSTNTRLAWVAVACGLVLVVGASYVIRLRSSVMGFGKAVAELRAGQTDLAMADLKKVASADPKFLLAPELLGDLQLQGNDPLAAILSFNQALKISPAEPSVKQNLALAYLGSGHYDAAQAEIPHLVAYEPDLATANYILGAASDLSGDTTPAITAFQEAIKHRPDFPEAQDGLARVEIQAGKLDDARSLYAAVLAKHPNDQAAIAGTTLLKSQPASRDPIAKTALPPLAIQYDALMSKSELWPALP